MKQSDKRLDAVFVQLVKHGVIELQTLFIGCFIDAVRIDARPRDRHAEDAKAHFGKQRDIFFVVMIKVVAMALRKKVVLGVRLALL